MLGYIKYKYNQHIILEKTYETICYRSKMFKHF